MSSLPQRSRHRDRELADGFAVGEVERGDGRATAGRVDSLLDLLQRGGGPGDEDDVRAGRGKRFGGGRADAAAGAGDERELVRQVFSNRSSPPRLAA